jgi:integrase
MEWGDVTPLRTKTIRLDEGDLFVTVVNAHGLQTDNATSYCMEQLRPTSMALATMQARMDAVCHFQNWCGENGIDFLQRLESGEYFLQHELASLRGALRRNMRKKAAPGRKWRRRRKSREKTVVDPAHWRNRCIAVRDYVAWFAEGIIQRMSARDGRLVEMRTRLASFKENIVDGIVVSRPPMKEGLDKEQEPIFIAAITPGDPSNPFAIRNHPRNYALWLTFHKGGLRLGELLGLKTTDCHLNGSRKYLIVHRRPDDREDKRRRKALAKTLPHKVYIDDHLAHVLHDFIVNHRPFYKGARRCPYVFMSEDGGELSHATIAYMYTELREKVPGLPEDFSTNDARRAWNNRFAAGAAQAGLSDEQSAVLANQQQGRVPSSPHAEAYRTRYNNEQSAAIINKMQDDAVRTSKETK